MFVFVQVSYMVSPTFFKVDSASYVKLAIDYILYFVNSFVHTNKYFVTVYNSFIKREKICGK